MSQKNLNTIYKAITELTNNEKKIILSKLISELHLSNRSKGATSISDIKGVGKEIWHSIDAQEYVKNERSTWK